MSISSPHFCITFFLKQRNTGIKIVIQLPFNHLRSYRYQSQDKRYRYTGSEYLGGRVQKRKVYHKGIFIIYSRKSYRYFKFWRFGICTKGLKQCDQVKRHTERKNRRQIIGIFLYICIRNRSYYRVLCRVCSWYRLFYSISYCIFISFIISS